MQFPSLPSVAPAAAPAAAPAPVSSVSRTSGAFEPPALIPPALWRSHVENNKGRELMREGKKVAQLYDDALVRSLPDGTALKLTAAGVQFYEAVTGTVMYPRDYTESSALLWAASLSDVELEALWLPQPPLTGEEGHTIPRNNGPELVRYFHRWQQAIMPASASVAFDVQTIAGELWDRENGVALELDAAELPESDEKKSHPPDPTGSLAPSTPSAAETQDAGQTSFSAPDTEPSSPPIPPAPAPPDSA